MAKKEENEIKMRPRGNRSKKASSEMSGVNKLIRKAKPSEKKLPIVYRSDRFVYAKARFGFSKAAREYFAGSRSGGEAICHRVSFRLMADALINAANFYIANYQNPGDFDVAGETTCYILGIIMAVTGKFPKSMELSDGFINNFIYSQDPELKEYQTHVNSLLKLFRENKDLGPKEDQEIFTEITKHLNSILNSLNNEKYNLRLGDASLNSSIGSAFDCSGGVRYIDIQGKKVFLLSDEDSEVLTLLINMTKPGGKNLTDSGLFLYTGSRKDGEAALYRSTGISKLKNAETLSLDIPIIYYNKYDQKFYDFVKGTSCEQLDATLRSVFFNPQPISAVGTAQRHGTETGMPSSDGGHSREKIGLDGLIETCDTPAGATGTKKARAVRKTTARDQRRNCAETRSSEKRKASSGIERKGGAARGRAERRRTF